MTHIKSHLILNKLRFLLIAGMLYLSIPFLFAQIPISWSQNLGNTQKNILVDIIDIPGQGSLAIGYTRPDANQAIEFWANRLNNDGTVVWSKNLGSSGFDRATAAVRLDDGNFVIVGYGMAADKDFNSASKKSDGIVVHMDEDGNINWVRSYGDIGHDQFADVLALDSGELLVVGSTTSYANTFADRASDGWAVKINSNGGVVWNRRFGGSLMDSYNKAILNPDGSFMLGGTSSSRDLQSPDFFGATDLWLSKINADGTHAWSRNYGGSQKDELNAMVATIDGGFVLGATSFSAMVGSKGHGDIWVLKVSALGNQIWQNILGGTSTDKCTALATFEEDGFLLAGSTMSNDEDVANNLGGQDAWLSKLSALGSVEWSTNLGGTQNDAINALDVLEDGSVWLAGYSFSSDNDLSANLGMQDGWVMRSIVQGPPVVSLGGNQEICVGAEVTLDATDINCSTCTYLWNDGVTEPDRTILVTGSNTYSVTLTNSAGEMTSDAVNISAVAQISANANIMEVSCADGMDGSISLQVSGGTSNYTYNWSNTDTTMNISDLTSGTYFVTISDEALCEYTNNFVVDNPTPIIIDAEINSPSCTSAKLGSISLQVSGGEPLYSYDWSNALIGPVITNLEPGQYTVTVTDARNCEQIKSFELSNEAIINIAPDIMHVSCNEGTDGEIFLNVTGDNPPYSFQWDNGIASNSLVGLSAGDYTVTVTDAMDCQLITKYTIMEPAPLSAVEEQNNTTSSGPTGSILLNVVGGVPPYDVVWNIGETGTFIDNLDAGIYEATITDANDCTLVESYEITLTVSTTSFDTQTLEVFPNPSLGLIYIQLPDALATNYSLRLVDIRGREVSYQTSPSATAQIFLEVDNYIPGLYLLTLVDDRQTYQAKIVLQ